MIYEFSHWHEHARSLDIAKSTFIPCTLSERQHRRKALNKLAQRITKSNNKVKITVTLNHNLAHQINIRKKMWSEGIMGLDCSHLKVSREVIQGLHFLSNLGA